MSGRTNAKLLLFGAFALAAAALCVRLGVWQLHRLDDRRAYNTQVQSRFTAGAESIQAALARDTADARWRRVTVRGKADYEREVVLASRTRGGSPGVWLVTPIVQPASDTLVALVRGWVYSPNGRTIDYAQWKEADTVQAEGRLDAFQPQTNSPIRLPSDARAFRRIELDSLSATWGAPVAPLLVYQSGDTIGGYAETGGQHPARFPVPSMNEGPHRSYAVQWFSFATVFVVGYGAVVFTSRRQRPAAT